MKERQKLYFLDYTEQISYAKRIYMILYRKQTNGLVSISFDDLIRAMRWDRGVFDFEKTKQLKMSIDVKTYAIERSLDILKQLGLISDIHKKYVMKYKEESRLSGLNFIFDVRIKPNLSDFDSIVSKSGFAPVEGRKQKLTNEMRSIYLERFFIDYNAILSKITDVKSYFNTVKTFINLLIPFWKETYSLMGNHVPYIENRVFPTFSVLYDHIGPYGPEEEDILSDNYVEDRAVVAFGISSSVDHDRKQNDYYMKGDSQRRWADKNTDRGHFIAHTIGGDISTNIFPQSREINQGHSERGKVYIAMESYLRKNKDIFCFSRPIYFDFFNRPYLLEYAYLTKDFKFHIEVFENV